MYFDIVITLFIFKNNYILVFAFLIKSNLKILKLFFNLNMLVVFFFSQYIFF